jgi:hypothetical protein
MLPRQTKHTRTGLGLDAAIYFSVIQTLLPRRPD